jgi:DNA-binding transcriptional MocR family regulator
VILELVQDLKRPDVVPLGLGFVHPDLLPGDDLTRAAIKAIRRLKSSELIRDIAPGDPELRRLIALRYLMSGLAIADEDIVIMNGGLEAVVLCLRALTKPGDTVAVEAPNWWPQLDALGGLGLRVQEISTHPRTGLDLESLEIAFRSRAVQACLVMPTFHNPLGSVMPEENKRAFAQLVERYKIPAIENDRLIELYFDPPRPRPVKAFDNSGYVLHCGCFATCIAPGYLVGWVTAGRYRREVMRTRTLLSISTPAACQAVMSEYLAHGPVDRHLRRMREALAIRCKAMVAAIAKEFPVGCRMTHPVGGLAVWVELPKGTDALKLYRLAFAKGVSIAPGPMFSARHDFRNCMALYFGVASVQQIHEGVRTVASLIERAST